MYIGSKNLTILHFVQIKKKEKMMYGINPLPDIPILGYSNSAANKDMTSKIWTNGDAII